MPQPSCSNTYQLQLLFNQLDIPWPTALECMNLPWASGAEPKAGAGGTLHSDFWPHQLELPRNGRQVQIQMIVLLKLLGPSPIPAPHWNYEHPGYTPQNQNSSETIFEFLAFIVCLKQPLGLP